MTTARISPSSGKLVSSKVDSGLTGITSRLSPPRTGGMMPKISELKRNSSNSKLEQLKKSHYPAGRRSPPKDLNSTHRDLVTSQRDFNTT